MAAALFRQAGVRHRLIPSAIALGAFTFTMTALPDTPAIQNAIPVSGAWSVVTALAIAALILAVIHRERLPLLRKTLDAVANASVLPVLNTASLVGFSAVVAALPAFAVAATDSWRYPAGRLCRLPSPPTRSVVLPARRQANWPSRLTSWVKRMSNWPRAWTFTLKMHRVAAISSGALAMLPHNGSVVTLLAICGLPNEGAIARL